MITETRKLGSQAACTIGFPANWNWSSLIDTGSHLYEQQKHTVEGHQGENEVLQCNGKTAMMPQRYNTTEKYKQHIYTPQLYALSVHEY